MGRRGFGKVSMAERRNADLFFSSLTGEPRAGLRGGLGREGWAESWDDEAWFETNGSHPTTTTTTTTTTTAPGRLTRSAVGAVPPGTTIYADIRLNSEDSATPMTGIYIPSGFSLGSATQIDVILYLHGHKRGMRGVEDSHSIDRYWDIGRYDGMWPLRERLEAAGKQVILVAPTLGPRSQPGRLLSGRGYGFDWYMGQVLRAIEAHGGLATPTPTLSVRNLILAAHSGGGSTMRRIARGTTTHASTVRECWAFDSMYSSSGPRQWRAWATTHPTGKLAVFFHPSSRDPRRYGERLAAYGLANVTVTSSTARDHFWVPIEHWQSLITASTNLR